MLLGSNKHPGFVLKTLTLPFFLLRVSYGQHPDSGKFSMVVVSNMPWP
jgi:hypothetical protein